MIDPRQLPIIFLVRLDVGGIIANVEGFAIRSGVLVASI
jgi:hypothetical protein